LKSPNYKDGFEMQKIKELFTKYREIISYTFFGGLTTLVNMLVYYLLMLVPFFKSDLQITVFGETKSVGYLIANAIAFVVAVIFAYVVNRNFVFGNKVSGVGNVAKQFVTFFATRLLSFGIEEILLLISVDVIGISEYIAKWPVAVVVVVLNYIFGKLIVFKKK